MKQQVRGSVQRHGRAGAVNEADMVGNGMFRILLWSGIGLVLFEMEQASVLAFSGVVLGLLLGLLVILGRPVLLANYLATMVLDVIFVGLVVAGGGGRFLLLFSIAALSMLLIEGAGRVAFAACFSVAVYVAALFAVTGGVPGAEGLLSAGIFAVFCAILYMVSEKNRAAQEDGRRLRDALESERGYSGSVSSLALNFRPVLEVLDLQRILEWTVGTARELTSARFAHVVILDGNSHATSTDGELDVSPTWWHPSLQEIVLRGSRHDGILSEPDKRAEGMTGFIAAPLRIPGSEHNGTLVLCGKEFDDNDERVLTLISDQASSALASAWESPGGRDFATGLPNRDSLYRTLEELLSQDAPVTVVCLSFHGLWDDYRVNIEGERMLKVIGGRINESQRTYRYSSEELLVLLRSGGEKRAERFCKWALEVVNGTPGGGSATKKLAVRAGYVVADPAEYDATSAIGQARRLAQGREVASHLFPDVPEASDTVVAALLEATTIRDARLAEHMKSVRSLARMIGSEMALEKKEMEVLSLGAMLHDIGKIGVPDEVLKKPGKLTAGEYELIKHHTVMGAGVISQVPHLSEIVPIVRHHHERHDGRGYPDGLAGHGIPVFARIVFVADAYDSMVQDRPYRDGLSHERAVQEIEDNAGTQFDPEVVEVFVKIAAGLRSDRFRRASG